MLNPCVGAAGTGATEPIPPKPKCLGFCWAASLLRLGHWGLTIPVLPLDRAAWQICSAMNGKTASKWPHGIRRSATLKSARFDVLYRRQDGPFASEFRPSFRSAPWMGRLWKCQRERSDPALSEEAALSAQRRKVLPGRGGSSSTGIWRRNIACLRGQIIFRKLHQCAAVRRNQAIRLALALCIGFPHGILLPAG